jgi:nucleotide-binding universal stress UspA family protein
MEARGRMDSVSSSGGFDRVLVGIDDTAESLVAAAQAEVVRADAAEVVLVAVAERYLAAHAGAAAIHAGDAVAAGTLDELEGAKALIDADATVVASGRLTDVLLRECATRGGSLIVIGARPHGRLTAAVFGGHDVEALHDATCSVLIARPGWGPKAPDRIVVAVDASPEARAAEDVARGLGAKLGVEVVSVIGLAERVDPELLRAERKDAVFEPGPLADAVVAASSPGTLLVVGDDRHGRRADLAERVVWHARCSVLVVRGERAAEA